MNYSSYWNKKCNFNAENPIRIKERNTERTISVLFIDSEIRSEAAGMKQLKRENIYELTPSLVGRNDLNENSINI